MRRFLRLGLLIFVSTRLAGLLPAAEPNLLSPAEERDGWQLLFNGRDTSGWKGFGKAAFPAAGWEVTNGWLHHLPQGGGGDIITTRVFTDFELVLDWRIAAGANSGLKYFIDEKRGAPIGHEYQLIDDLAHPDAAHEPKHQTASLYDALAPKQAPVRPAGEVNTSRIVVRGDRVEHWLNGIRVLEYTLGSPELAAAKAASKFKDEARWGTKFPTPILLQDHHDEVWIQNVKIRELTP